MTRLEGQLTEALLILGEIADELPVGSAHAQTLIQVVQLLERLDTSAGQRDTKREEVSNGSTMTH